MMFYVGPLQKEKSVIRSATVSGATRANLHLDQPPDSNPAHLLSSSHTTMSVTLSASAYTLPLLHAARHPASTVLGLLLARGAEIVEALPILHRYASLSLTIDTALRFVRAHAKDNGLTIAGVYIANEDGSTKVPRVAERLLETIRKENPSTIGLVVSGRLPRLSMSTRLPLSGATQSNERAHCACLQAFGLDTWY